MLRFLLLRKGVRFMKTELLAPAGNYESFIQAINNGADAIYLAGKNFNALERKVLQLIKLTDTIAFMLQLTH